MRTRLTGTLPDWITVRTQTPDAVVAYQRGPLCVAVNPSHHAVPLRWDGECLFDTHRFYTDETGSAPAHLQPHQALVLTMG